MDDTKLLSLFVRRAQSSIFTNITDQLRQSIYNQTMGNSCLKYDQNTKPIICNLRSIES